MIFFGNIIIFSLHFCDLQTAVGLLLIYYASKFTLLYSWYEHIAPTLSLNIAKVHTLLINVYTCVAIFW